MLYWALGFLGVSFFTTINYNWRDQVAAGFIWAALVCIWNGLKQYDFTFKAALSFLVFHVGYFVLQQKTPYPTNGDANFPIKMDVIILHSMVGIAVCVGAAHLFLKKHSALFLTAICAMTLLGSVLIIFKPIFGLEPTAFLNSDSMDSTLIAICFPFLRRVGFDMKSDFKKALFLGLPVAAVLIAHSSMGLLCLAVAIASHIPIKGTAKELRNSMMATAGITVGIVLVGVFLLQQETFNFNGRLAIWQASMEFWDKYVNKFSGAGLSTFNHFGNVIQHMFKVDYIRTRWIWMHSDWLQTLFETGTVGLACAVAMAIRSLMITYRRSPMFFSSLLTIFVACLAQMPFRYFPSGFICLLVLMQSLMLFDDEGNRIV